MFKNNREFLKDSIRKSVDFSKTPQSEGFPAPPIEKIFPANAKKTALVKPGAWSSINKISVENAIAKRKSHRSFTNDPLSLGELSFLLWSTQGVRENIKNRVCFRTVPSAGCRHAFETYLAVFRVEGLEKGIYRYLPLSHELVFLKSEQNLEEKVSTSTFGQNFSSEGAVTFYWSAIPSRMEWRYAEASYKVIAIDAGHVCQNLYIACAAIDAGTCAIAAYDQEYADKFLELDGDEEFIVYIAPVGKILC